MKNHPLIAWILLAAISVSWAGKQRILIRLREPLRAETVTVKIPELTNGRGETRDLETQVELGAQVRPEAAKGEDVSLKLDMMVRTVGKTGAQVTLSLPAAGFVEIEMLDFYGKNLATVLSAHMQSGVHPLQPISFKDGDNNGIKFLTLRINGKVALKKVITKVR